MQGALLAGLLGGCQDEGVQRQLYALQQQVTALQQQNTNLAQRLAQLEAVDELTFNVVSFRYRISEDGFVPKLIGSAKIALNEQAAPNKLFLDLEYEIRLADGSRYPGGRHHILLENGQGLLVINLELPRFGMQHQQAELTFRPLNWFEAKPAKLSGSIMASPPTQQRTEPASPFALALRAQNASSRQKH